MQILKLVAAFLIVVSSFAAGPGISGGGGGGGPGSVLLSTQKMIPGGGGGNGGPGVTISNEDFGAQLRANLAKYQAEKKAEETKLLLVDSQFIALEDVVDVRLENDEVLDVEQLQDRYGSEVQRVGRNVFVPSRIPIADYQDSHGEIKFFEVTSEEN